MRLSNRRLLFHCFDSTPLVRVLLWAAVLSKPVIEAVFSRRREAAAFMVIDFSAQIQLLVVGCALTALLLTGELLPVLRSIWKTSAGALFLYYLLCVLSSLWSPIPSYSIFRAVEFIAMFAVVLIIINRSRDFYNAERRIILLAFLAVACGILNNWRMWNLSIDIFRGSLMGIPSAMVFCYCAGEAPRASNHRRRFLLICGALALAHVVVARSSTNNIAICCGLLVASLLAPSGKIKSLGILAVFSIVFLGLTRGFLLPGKTHEQIMNLHGRISLWDQYMLDFKEHPVLGRGFAVSARLGDFYASNTHSSIFAVLSGTGLAGMAIVSLGMIRGVKESMKALKLRPDGSIGCIAGLTVGLVGSLSTPVFLEQWYSSSTVLTSILAVQTLWVVGRVNQSTLGGIPWEVGQAHYYRT